ncbi:MAG: hypothetical protein OXC11_14370 [Rhodospirillales bacterium]|nr:hypothetical protein [Rhodospirillales bacterium]
MKHLISLTVLGLVAVLPSASPGFSQDRSACGPKEREVVRLALRAAEAFDRGNAREVDRVLWRIAEETLRDRDLTDLIDFLLGAYMDPGPGGRAATVEAARVAARMGKRGECVLGLFRKKEGGAAP